MGAKGFILLGVGIASLLALSQTPRALEKGLRQYLERSFPGSQVQVRVGAPLFWFFSGNLSRVTVRLANFDASHFPIPIAGAPTNTGSTPEAPGTSPASGAPPGTGAPPTNGAPPVTGPPPANGAPPAPGAPTAPDATAEPGAPSTPGTSTGPEDAPPAAAPPAPGAVTNPGTATSPGTAADAAPAAGGNGSANGVSAGGGGSANGASAGGTETAVAPGKTHWARISRINLQLLNFVYLGQHIEGLQAQLPNVRYDFGAAKRQRILRLGGSGTGTVDVTLSEDDLNQAIKLDRPDIRALRIHPEQGAVRATLDYQTLLGWVPVSVTGQLQVVDGHAIYIVNPVIGALRVTLPQFATDYILRRVENVNPVFDLDKLQLPLDVNLTSVESTPGTVVVHGSVKVPGAA